MHAEKYILDDFRKGDLRSLYSSMYRSLMSFAHKCLPDSLSFLEEDCVQDAIYKAYTIRESFNSFSSLKSFLYTTVHNKTVDLIRKNTSRENYLASETEKYEDLIDKIVEQETLRMLFETVGKLSAREKDLFFCYSDGLTTKEIAQKLGLSESAIKKCKTKMINNLRDKLSK